MKRFLTVCGANIRAHVWCLFHPTHCIIARYEKSKTVSIEVGSGSLLCGTWETKKVFYKND